MRYRGVLFHVQTEDSGKANPHVITHLFHGGNIMASEKRDYSDRLDAEDLGAAVKELMEEQHKAMLRRLKNGECDADIIARAGPVFPDAKPDELEADALDADLGADLLEDDLEAELEVDPADGLGDTADTAATLPPPLDEALDAPQGPLAAAGEASNEPARSFGERVVSAKPLDEVVLDFLVENARKRKRKP